jgi:5-methyltetrahydrofolate--homocysteine methyltransferase
MSRLLRELSQQVAAPLVIDSTEYPVIEAALKLVPARAIVNSIHLEGTGERLHRVAPMLKRYGGSAVAMLIDETGMAKTAPHKIEVARRIYQLITEQYALPPHALIFDPLVFTLATGEEEFKTSALDTFEAIRWIKAHLPGTYTILGVSNASFGLTPPARRVLNSVYLYHATQAGLDLAIVNPKEIIPYPMLTDTERNLADALVLNEADTALADFIAYFEQYQANGQSHPGNMASQPEVIVNRTVEEQIHYQVLARQKEGIEIVLDDALKSYTAAQIINQILLPAMKEVGEKMATGELILPFVLQSAEVMKRSVAYLEPFMDKSDVVSRGTLVLATVYGDVHDIGKNLVKTIFSNNGYVVHDLGKQVPLTDILAKAKEVKADAIGLSALLVTTSKQMAYCVEECHTQDLHYPIIIGGAAINRDYGFRISCLGEDLVYPGGVFYSKDAFEGLSTMNRLMDPASREDLLQEYQTDMVKRREKAERYREAAADRAAAAPSALTVRPAPSIPQPPFWGMRRLDPADISLDDVYPLMDFPSLFRLSWGLKNMPKEQYEAMLETQYHPLLANLLTECKADGILQPEVLYGYCPCYRDGDDLLVLDPDTGQEKERFHFPRQTERDRLCLSDYFSPAGSTSPDILPLQLVTMGPRVSEVCNALDQAGEYAKSYYLHGVAVQMADALAEWTHRRIKAELGMTPEQGKRYSFGYPACPDLGDQVKQFALMEVKRHMSITLTEAYQMEPEQSTSALVIHHPDAKYYSI